MKQAVEFNVEGNARRDLAFAIGEIVGETPTYKRHPINEYSVAGIVVSRFGTANFDESVDNETLTKIFDGLKERGYKFDYPTFGEVAETPVHKGIMDLIVDELNANAGEDEHFERLHSEPTIIDGNGREHSLDGQFVASQSEICEEVEEGNVGDVPASPARVDTITIEIPAANVNEQTLCALLKNKNSLIEAALGDDCAWKKERGTNGLPIEFENGVAKFEWLRFGVGGEVVQAWSEFLCRAVKFSQNVKRVTAVDEGLSENNKFDFRVLCVKFGLNGGEFKATRKVLSRFLTGSSSFKSTESAERWNIKHGRKADNKGENGDEISE